jgi:hypothetical protein
VAAPLPPFFRSLRLLQALNVAGVGLALSAVTGGIFGRLFGAGSFSTPSALSTAGPTLLVGTTWALLLRWRRRTPKKQWRWGWVLAAPLAVVNGALAASLLFGHRDGLVAVLVTFIPYCLLCATVGVIFWLPALLLTLLAFGLPIAWSQRQAARGLAGEERGEIAVGSIVVLVSLAALLLTAFRPPSENLVPSLMGDFEAPERQRIPAAFRAPDSAAVWALDALALLGLSAGGTATALAARRERRRRRFVALAEAGEAPGFRVDATTEGKVLVRVASPEPGAYRAASPEAEDEELFALDEQGLATHPSRIAAGSP